MNFKNLPIEIEQLIYSYDDTYKPTMNPKSIWCEIQSHCVDKARKRIFKKYDFQTAMKICFWQIDEDDFDSDFDSDDEISETDLETLSMINDDTYDIFD